MAVNNKKELELHFNDIFLLSFRHDIRNSDVTRFSVAGLKYMEEGGGVSATKSRLDFFWRYFKQNLFYSEKNWDLIVLEWHLTRE